MTKARTKQLVVCVDNDGYAVSLEKRKIYVSLRDAAAEKQSMLRIVDESGDDYLYPKAFFRAVDLPMAVKRAVMARSDSLIHMTSRSRGADVSGSCAFPCLSETQRAQGMPGAGRTRRPCGLKRKVPTSQYRPAETSGTPCAMALRLTPRSPRCVGLFSHRRCADRPRAHLTPASGDRTTRLDRTRLRRTSCGTPRPSHPASRLVTNGRTPLMSRRDGFVKS